MPQFRPDDIAVITFNDVPQVNLTFKYEVLGRMAIDNRRRYCERHGYRFICEAPIVRDRPACWAKIPTLLAALETHPWAMWADSDTLVFAQEQRIDEMCDPDYDLIVQSHEEFFRFIGMPHAAGLNRMPINTGVFLIRASAWSRDFLERAYEETQFVSRCEVWDGIGEQEAMIALLRRAPGDRRRIKYVNGLQNHPRFYRPGDLFVHFYGNHARHRIPLAECHEIIGRWDEALRGSGPLPPDRARFHWCCIQNKRADSPVVRGDLPRYLYQPDDIMPAPPGG
jgi:galactosyl transferase GMA12/MNN10 family